MSSIFKNNKDSKENRILDAFFFAKTKLHFTYLLPDFSNIDEVYTNNLNIWFLNNSENKETKDGKGIEILNGILLNPENIIFSKTKEGFELTEIDFINSELKSFEFLEFDKLNLIEQKQFKIYNEFLNKKKLHINWNLSDFLNHYKETKRFGFTFLKTYKKEAFEDLKDQLNKCFLRFCYILKNIPIEDKTELISDFKDQLLQLKNKQTITKFSLKIDEFLNLIDKEIKNQNTIVKYKNSFNPTTLEDILNFKNEDGTINTNYYLKLFNEYKNHLNEQLNKYSFDNEYLPYLRNFNLGIENLLIEIIKHYKNVLNFESSKMQNFEHYNYRDSINLKESLNFLKSYSSKLIDLKLEDKEINHLKKVQDYCIKILLESLTELNRSFEIDVFNSPLSNDLLSIKKAIKKAIDKNDLKQLNKKTNTTTQQTENFKTDESYKSENLFKVGLLFAKGEMNKYYTISKRNEIIKKGEYSAPKISEEIKENLKININDKYILASLNNYNTNKNIFNSLKMMTKIISHCEAENIEIDTFFKSRIDELKLKQ